MLVEQWNVAIVSLYPVYYIGSAQFKETSLSKVSTNSFCPVVIKSQSYHDGAIFVHAFSHVSLRGPKSEKEKRDFPLDPMQLSHWLMWSNCT